MKTNYQKQTDAVIAALPAGGKPRMLLQSCCGPCSSYVLEYLTRYFRVTVLYYNPNIQPREEYDKRLHWQREILAQLPTPEAVGMLECSYDGAHYAEAVRGLEREPEGGARCTVCFRLRLEETARLAKAHGFDFFRTRTPSDSTPSARSLRRSTAWRGCRRTSKSARATSAASSCQSSTACTGRITAAACSANRLTSLAKPCKIRSATE